MTLSNIFQLDNLFLALDITPCLFEYRYLLAEAFTDILQLTALRMGNQPQVRNRSFATLT